MSPEVLLLIIRVLAALSLYAFIGVTVFTLWRTMPLRAEREFTIPEIYAVEVEGEGWVENHKLRIVNQIGRAADNTIILSDERVSAHHARISFTGGQWLLEDLGSRNGTFVNDLQIEGPIVVTIDDRIQIGATLFTLQERLPETNPTVSP